MKVVTFYHDIEQDVNVPCDLDACRETVKSMLALEAAHGIRTTYNVVGALWEDQPEIVDWIRAGHHEVAFHSFYHHVECAPEQFAREVAACRQHAPEPVGYRSPRSRWNEDTLDSLCEHDFRWTAESDPAPAPFQIRPGLVRLPIAGDDWPLHKGTLDEDGWVDRFRAQLAEREYIAIGVHDCVVSHRPAQRLRAWERCFEIAADSGARIVTFGEAARALVAGDVPGNTR